MAIIRSKELRGSCFARWGVKRVGNQVCGLNSCIFALIDVRDVGYPG